jgi:hypothetical protein
LLGARQSGAGGAEWPFGLAQGPEVAGVPFSARPGLLSASWLGLGAKEGGNALEKKYAV